ncbi:MAG: hypothetical protein Q9160_002912 [Pyrenula sp. 1 TL-2023]
MAFSLSNNSGAFGAQPIQSGAGLQSPEAIEGQELQEVSQNALIFKTIGGESKVQISKPWPADSLPLPTASLLAVASSKDLVIAAGSDSLVIAKASTVRSASKKRSTDQESFQPDLAIPTPRLTQVALSADENVMVISAESGGGLVAYQVDRLLNNQTNPALQLPTNNKALRALAANPTKAELFAAVTVDGELLVANLKENNLISGPNGVVLKEKVSCVAWSNKGKQVVAGLADGTAYQMTPEGEGKAIVPKPPSIPEDMHISAISWLETDVFLMFYSENSGVSSETYIVTRKKNTAEFEFQKLPEVCPPFGMERSPNVPLLARLRNYPPHLTDAILVGSTCATDIGLVTKAEKALSSEAPVTGAYATTSITDDQNKACLPFGGEGDTTPIGLAVDLSSHDTVFNPLQTHADISVSKYPVPNLLVLNNEGFISTWNIIYADSIVEEKAYPQLVATGGFQQQIPSNQPSSTEASETVPVAKAASNTPQAGFGQSGFGQTQQPSSFGQSGFGKGAATSFGTSTPLGGAKPSWVSTGIDTSSKPQTGGSGFGKLGFGSPATLGTPPARSGFGASPLKAGSTPAFGQSTFGKSAFGQSSNAPSAASPFATSNNKQASGFSGFASAGGMSGFGAGAAKSTNASPFGAKSSAESPFGNPATPLGGDTDMTSSFGTPESKPTEPKTSFGFPQSGLRISSTFKPESQSDSKMPDNSLGGGSIQFGKGFDDLLKEAKDAVPVESKDENMDDDNAADQQPSSAPSGSNIFTTDQNASLTSALTDKQSKPPPAMSSIFGTQPKPESTPANITNNLPTWGFGSLPSTTPKEEPTGFGFPKSLGDTPKIKTEPPSDNEATTPISKIPAQPIPPDSVSKTTYTPGDTSTSSIGSQKSSSADEPPLPPDFSTSHEPSGADEPPLPPDSETHKSFLGEEPPPPPDFTDTRNKALYSTSDLPEFPQTKNVSTHDDKPLKEAPRPAKSGAEGVEAPLQESDGPESDLDGSYSQVSDGESETDDPISPSKTDEVAEDHTDELKTSPESSFERTEEFTETSRFTQENIEQHPALFGEGGSGIPKFPPPRHVPESPRSPSPVRNFLDARARRLEPSRSVSAPTRPPNIIENRRAELGKGSQPGRAPLTFAELRQRDKQVATERTQIPLQKEPEQEQEVDEDELLREELERPVSPSQDLAPFLPHQASEDVQTSQGIPGQIERLYNDVNSMISTLGINARALSAFVLHQTQAANADHQQKVTWNTIFRADDALNILEDDWVLGDIACFHHGEKTLGDLLDEVRISDPSEMLQQCHSLLSKDIVHLRSRLSGIRRTFHAIADTKSTASAPLSGEQAALQDDLRKASTTIQTKLAQAERSFSLLRAKLSETAPPPSQSTNDISKGGLTRSNSQKKPTVEAVTNTIAKMTSMAERKSSDIDVLESQLRKMNLGLGGSVNGSRETSLEPDSITPRKQKGQLGSSRLGRTPATPGSVYHTPDSRLGASTASLRASVNGKNAMVSAEDADQWRDKARRKKEVTNVLRAALMARRSKAKEIPHQASWKPSVALAQ